jgi:murein DD-endopeptidase MepM/ murein hydrolase activator NlpD
MGLQTLYSHLSGFEVAVGDEVERGQTLGRTGKTGLAVGDHLHYEVLVHGIPVNPMEWWDAKWIEAKVFEVMDDAGIPRTH